MPASGALRLKLMVWIAFGVAAALLAVPNSPPGSALLALSLGSIPLIALISRRARAPQPILGRLRLLLANSQAALAEDQPEEALAILATATERERENAWVRMVRAFALGRLGQLEAASEEIGTVIEQYPGLSPAVLVRATIAVWREDTDAARDLLVARLRAERPDLQGTLFLSGLLSVESGDYESAESDFSRAALLKEADASALAGLAIARLEKGVDPLEVSPIVERAVSIEQAQILVRIAGARLELASGRAEVAARLVEQELLRLDVGRQLGWASLLRRWAGRWGIPSSPIPPDAREAAPL